MQYKLGKTAPSPVGFKLKDFTNPSALPQPPKNFGHETLINPSGWGMLGNDEAGDCVIAAKMHIQMLMSSMGKKSADFQTKDAIDLYTKLTGYDPNDPNTDNGTDMKEAAAYWRSTGIQDSKGNIHQIKAYVGFEPSNITELYQALYLFGAVDIGIQFPSTAMDQFKKNQPWSVVKGAGNEGGHDVCLVAKRQYIECISWGKIQPMTVGFYGQYNDESFAYVSEEALCNNKSPEGFDCEGLLAALKNLK